MWSTWAIWAILGTLSGWPRFFILVATTVPRPERCDSPDPWLLQGTLLTPFLYLSYPFCKLTSLPWRGSFLLLASRTISCLWPKFTYYSSELFHLPSSRRQKELWWFWIASLYVGWATWSLINLTKPQESGNCSSWPCYAANPNVSQQQMSVKLHQMCETISESPLFFKHYTLSRQDRFHRKLHKGSDNHIVTHLN